MAAENITILIQSKGHNRIVQRFKAIGQAATDAQKRVKALGTDITGLGARSGRGVQKVEASVKKVDASVTKLGTTVTQTKNKAKGMWESFGVPGGVTKGVNRLVGAFLGFRAVAAITQVSDEFIRMNNTLKGFGVAANEIGRVRKQINELSINARVSAVETATLFGRLRLATRDFGTSQKDVLKVTQTVSKALRLSGSSGLEASQSIRQLSQAFNKGKLDGDEFRSVMENAPIIQELLSRQLGVTKQSLFDMAQAGKITAKELTAAFIEGADEIDKTFGELDFTFRDFFQNFVTKFREAFGPKASNTLKLVGKTIGFIGDNIGVILDVSIKLGLLKIWSISYAGAVKYLTALEAVKVATQGLAAATSAYNAANVAAVMGRSSPGPKKGTSAYYAANMTALMVGGSPRTRASSLAAGATAVGGTMLRLGGKAIPYAVVAMVAYDLLNAMGMFGKSAQEMADAARNASEEMVAAKLKLIPARRPEQALPDLETSDLYGEYSRKNHPDLYGRRQAMRQPGAATQNMRGFGGVPLMAGGNGSWQMLKDLWSGNMPWDDPIPDEAVRAQATADLSKAVAGAVAEGQAGMKPLAEWPADVLRLNITKSMGRLDEILKLAADAPRRAAGLGDTTPAKKVELDKLRTEILTALPGKGADLSFLNDGFDVGSSKGLASLISLFRKYKDAIPLTEQEKLGNSMEQAATSIENYKKKLEEMNDASKVFAGSPEELDRAVRYTEEQIDKLAGGFKTLEDVAKSARKNMSKVIGADEGYLAPTPLLTPEELSKLEEIGKLRDLAAAVAAPGSNIKQILEQVRATLGAVDAENSLMESIMKTVDGFRQSTQAAEDRVTTLKNMRKAITDLGKTEAELNREEFAKSGAPEGGDQLREFDKLSQDFAVKKFDVSSEGALENLKKQADALRVLQSLATTAEDKSFVATSLQKLTETASQLGGAIGSAGREGAEKIIQDAGVSLKEIAGTVGTELGTALANAFNAAAQGVKDAIESGAIPKPAANSATLVDTPALSEATQQIDATASSLNSMSQSLTTAKNNFNGFGSFAAVQLKKTSSAAENSAREIQGFFESAFGSLEDALVGFVTTGEFDFKKLMNAIMADLARLIVRMLIIKPLMSLLGGFFGFAHGGRVPGYATGGKIPKYSTGGGMIGGYGGSTSDRYAAMVSPGEAVLSTSAVRRNRGLVGQILAGKKVERKTAGGGGGVAVTYAPVINVAGGPEGGGEQRGQEIQAVIERGFMELLGREMRPNGALEGLSRREFA